MLRMEPTQQHDHQGWMDSKAATPEQHIANALKELQTLAEYLPQWRDELCQLSVASPDSAQGMALRVKRLAAIAESAAKAAHEGTTEALRLKRVQQGQS